ncbi:hypothetical protein Hypma_004525 [Hypsizygus marmoreus]|uniref:Uncharacterized protein n=1 Tax=Hypsizygus marmoreus TaxID=39966 RepID=A0A369JYF8_HYPMA|nr:hypothetical protein Hypma_004525 [Hypsizygus marmoreus]
MKTTPQKASTEPETRNTERKNAEKILSSLKTTLTMAKAIASFTPVPGLSKAIQALLTIITLYEASSRNKEQLLELKTYIETEFVAKIVTPIAAASKVNTIVIIPSDIQERLESLSRQLVVIANDTKSLNIKGARHLIRNAYIPDTLNVVNRKLGTALRGFWNIRSKL